MAVKPAGSDEETTDSGSESGSSAPAPAGAEGSSGAGPMPTAPAPVGVSQAVSSAPESVQMAPPPAPTMSSEGAPGAGPMVRSQPGAMMESTDAQTSAKTTAMTHTPTTTKVDKEGKGTKTGGKAVEPAQDFRTMQSEFIQEFNDLWTKIAEGKDPVAAAEWNAYIQGTAPKHELALNAAAMRLKQSGNDGPGAGDALLTMFARDLEISEDQARAQITARSAQRLYDMNKWGIDKAMQMVKEERENKRSDFWDAVKLGQWDIASTLGMEVFGMPVDTNALKAADPATQSMVQNALKTADQLISQGKADEAKAIYEQLARTNPQAFGFTSSEQALAAVSQMDFKHEAWANLTERNNQILESARNYALSEDWAGLKQAVDNWANNQPPGVVDGMGQGIIKEANLVDINAYREAAGKTPITQAEVGTLDASEIAKDRQTFNIKQSAKGANGVEATLRSLTDAIPELKTNRKLYEATRRWIAEQQIVGQTANPVPPYSPDSQTVHFYADWPKVYWNGGTQETVDPDFDINEDSGAGMRDMTSEEGRRQDVLDKAYNAYLTNTPKEKRLSAKDWFFATQGNSRAIPKDQTPTTPDDIPDPTTPPKTIKDEAKGIVDSLKPSQKPPEGVWMKAGPTVMGIETQLYWDPDAGKYSAKRNDAYRAMYAEPTPGDGAITGAMAGVNFGGG